MVYFISFIYKIMEFPEDILSVVRDFSKPMTRPDWRDLHLLEAQKLHWLIAAIYNTRRVPVIEKFVNNYDQLNYMYIVHQGFVMNVKRI